MGERSVSTVAVARPRPCPSRATPLWRTGGLQRLVGLDVARCLALLGMMTAHIVPKMVNGRIPWSQRLATGNSAALFAVLAGTSLALLTGGRAPHGGTRRATDSVAIAARALMIMTIGFAVDQLHPPGIAVILPYYGLLFVVGIPFLWMRPSRLFALGGVWMIAAPVISQLARIPNPTADAGGGLRTLGVGGLLWRLGITGAYPAFTWAGYLLCGLAVGRLDLRERSRAAWLLMVGVLTAVFATMLSRALTALPSVHAQLLRTWPGAHATTWAVLNSDVGTGLPGVTPTGSWWWLVTDAPHSGASLDLFRSAGIAVAVIGGASLITRIRTRAWQVVFGAGAMTLTLYTAHLMMVLPETWPDYGPRRWLPEVTVVMVTGVVFAMLRLKGPLELLVAVITKITAHLVGRFLGATIGVRRTSTTAETEAKPSQDSVINGTTCPTFEVDAAGQPHNALRKVTTHDWKAQTEVNESFDAKAEY